MEANQFALLKEQVNQLSQQIVEAVEGYPPTWPYAPQFEQALALVDGFIEGSPPQKDSITASRFRDAVPSLTANDDPDGRLIFLLTAGVNLVEAVEAGWNHVNAVRAGVVAEPSWLWNIEQCLERVRGNLRDFQGKKPCL